MQVTERTSVRYDFTDITQSEFNLLREALTLLNKETAKQCDEAKSLRDKGPLEKANAKLNRVGALIERMKSTHMVDED